MKLRDWRIDAQISLRELAEKLGITGANPARNVQRYEKGFATMPSELIFRLEQLTDGQVTAQDMHEVRLEWLRAHKPDALLPVAQEVRA
jgi:transcriptional regulator with XRE-family HTH domain